MEDPFPEVRNSFFCSTFQTPHLREKMHIPNVGYTQSLGMISGLYHYTNPPPLAYGTPAPKVVETVKRSYEFNQKMDAIQQLIIGSKIYEIDNPVWGLENDEDFPVNDTGSNFHPGLVHHLAKLMLYEHHDIIDKTIEGVIEHASVSNSDKLTKGNQTWCPLSHSSVPSSIAYRNYCKFLEDNGKPKHHTILELIQYTIELMGAKTIEGKKLVITYRDVTKKFKKQKMRVKVRTKTMVDHTYEGEECLHYMIDLLRSFCSYLKSNERAHLKRRAIASPSIPLRALQWIVEEIHLKLGKELPGSTISIGGEEKKQKIISTINNSSIAYGDSDVKQATQDATKWNECLSPMLFGMLTQTWLDVNVRAESPIQLKKVSDQMETARLICLLSHMILNIKRITYGEGLTGKTHEYHGLIKYEKENLDAFNEETKKWVSWMLEKVEDGYLRASPGMLMGMNNALSTTVGLLPSYFRHGHPNTVQILRSSDDSMTKYSAKKGGAIYDLVQEDARLLRMCAINLSKKKTFLFDAGFGEYTSWFQDQGMVAQYGVETTTMRPGGKNPSDDFFQIAKTTSVSLMKNEINHIGATAKLRIGIDNVRSLYRIGAKDRTNISRKVMLLADGGLNPWNALNCDLEETSLKEKFITTDEEKEYMLLVRNPDNPFASHLEEDVNFNPETSSFDVQVIETPRNIFHFKKRGNRTAMQADTREKHAKDEKANAEAIKVINYADVTTHIRVPSLTISCANYVSSALGSHTIGLELTPEETEMVQAAMLRLAQKPKGKEIKGKKEVPNKSEEDDDIAMY